MKNRHLPLYMNEAIRSAYAEKLLRNPELTADEKIQKIYALFDRTHDVIKDSISGQYFFTYHTKHEKKHYTGPAVDESGLNGWRLLHCCALYGEWEVAERLIEQQGAKVDITQSPVRDDKFYGTPLFVAAGQAEKHALSMVRTLLKHGANINARTLNDVDNTDTGRIFLNMTPLHHAVRYGRVDIVEFLLQQGCQHDLKMGELAEDEVSEYKALTLAPRSQNVSDGALKYYKRKLHWSMTAIEYALHIKQMLQHPEHADYEHTFGSHTCRNNALVPSMAAMEDIITLLEHAHDYTATHTARSSLFAELEQATVRRLRDVFTPVSDLAVNAQQNIVQDVPADFPGKERHDEIKAHSPPRVAKASPTTPVAAATTNFFAVQEINDFNVHFSRTPEHLMLKGNYKINNKISPFSMQIYVGNNTHIEIKKFLDKVIDEAVRRSPRAVIFRNVSISSEDFPAGSRYFNPKIESIDVAGLKEILAKTIDEQIRPEVLSTSHCLVM